MTAPHGMGETAAALRAYQDLILKSPTALAVNSASEADIARFWNKVALPKQSGCMEWMGSRFLRGYAKFKINGRNVGGHRFILWHLEGPPPSVELQAAHSCGNACCVNPSHLRWATPGENTREQVQHGTRARGARSGNSKLTDDQVIEIRRRYSDGSVTQTALGKEYGVSQFCIWTIVREKQWTHLVTGGSR